MKKLSFLIGILVLFSVACKHQMVAPGTSAVIIPITNTGSGGSGNNPTDTVCFNSEVLPLYQSYCGSAGCHNATSAREGIILTDYFDIMKGIRANGSNSSRYYTIIGGSMPPRNSPQISSTQKATILKWINQSALNTTCTVTTCDSTKTTYSNGISTLFSTYCNGCHSASLSSGNVNLSDYANAKAAGTNLKTSFLNAINYTSATSAMNMPQGSQLSSCQILQITKWINNGCPQ